MVNSELAVLGGILKQPDLLYQTNLKCHDFAKPAARKLFKTLLKFNDDGNDIDEVKLSDHLNSEYKYEAPPEGWTEFLDLCTDACPTIHAHQSHVDLIAEKSRRYQLDRTIDGIASNIDLSPEQIIERLRNLPTPTSKTNSKSVVQPTDIISSLEDLYINGEKRGEITGLRSVDELVSFKKQQLTIITGSPGSGKSTFADNILIRLAKKAGWKFFVTSPENHPVESHVSRMAAKWLNRPFNQNSFNRMTLDQFNFAVKEISKHFWFLTHFESDRRLDNLLRLAEGLIRNNGINALSIDPWNKISPGDAISVMDKDFICNSLMRVQNFIVKNEVHCFIVAHPRKQPEDSTGNYKEPKLYDINGSSVWNDGADLGIILNRPHKNSEGPDKHIVDFVVEKVRFDSIGTPGRRQLRYRHETGIFTELNGNQEREFSEQELKELATGII